MQISRTTIIFLLGTVLSVGCGKSNEPTEAKGSPGSGAAASAQAEREDASKDAVDDARAEDEGDDDDDATLLAALDPKVQRAAAIADGIERDPDSSDEVLARADLDREGLDALMYEIAIDPELASQYRIARGLR